jgi:hypothetical protein
MHRRLMLATCLSTLLGACSDGPAVETDLAALVSLQSDFDGRQVVTEGVLQTFETPRHYWIEDADLNRVAIEPEAGLADRVGQRLRVRGRFVVDPDQGRRIDVSDILSIAQP